MFIRLVQIYFFFEFEKFVHYDRKIIAKKYHSAQKSLVTITFKMLRKNEMCMGNRFEGVIFRYLYFLAPYSL